MYFYYFFRNKLIILFATILSPILFVLAKKRRRDFGDAPRILVIPQLTRIGDLVCATPVFRAIKERYPKSFLAVMVTGKVTGIIKNNPHIDQIIQYKTKGYSNILENVGILKFDVGISLTPQPMATVTMLLGLIPRRIKLIREGRPVGEALTDWLNTETLLYRHHTFLPQRYLDLLRSIGIENASLEKGVFVSEAGERKVSNFLPLVLKGEDKGGGLTPPLVIGISITAGNKIKEWGDENFAELAKRILEKYKDIKIIFIGSKNDEPRIDNVLKKIGSPSTGSGTKDLYSLSGVEGLPIYKAIDFNLEELPSLIKRLDLYVAVDTGPIYIANALGVPTVDILGPVDPTEQPPCDGGKSVCVLPAGNIKPSSFVFKRPGRPEEHRKALEAINVELVLEAIGVL